MSVSKAHRDSCAQSKLNQQICKQPFSTYTDKKFNAAFILNAMSDDEDNPDYRPTSDEVRTFISRAPDYWSEILQTIYDNLEKIPDPKPSKEKAMTLHVHGPIINNYPLPFTKLLKHWLCAWQIKPKLLALAEYSNILGSSRLAYSGTAWGDEENPIDDGLNGVVHRKQKQSAKDGDKIFIRIERVPKEDISTKAQNSLDEILGKTH
ncbi:hypothetical protein SERLA73DRAFT_149646 [Serpula lacrymans var. lacrymans S7.3]|uniref:Uncharacterized protein n=2 Tax=Serpula lacrymans var. lacrymans TaxID=341189 RepID=F8PK29_SERL3|nr:hypothetical protein SERLA73DRAFT_149646 [Serpula lacrymans var. lacrymans S7.3]